MCIVFLEMAIQQQQQQQQQHVLDDKHYICF